MTSRNLFALTAALALAAGAASAEPVRVHLDQETVVGGVPVACTGIGQTKDDPKWRAYPVRVEFADAAHAYLAGETLTLTDAKGGEVLEVSCEGPWILMKLPAGAAYKVVAAAQGAPMTETVTIVAPAHGQQRFVLTFPIQGNAR